MIVPVRHFCPVIHLLTGTSLEITYFELTQILTMRTILILIVLAIACQSSAQSFEGSLTYTTEIELSPKATEMGITKELLMEKMSEDGTWADTVVMKYKAGDYVKEVLSDLRSRAVYKATEGKIYTFTEANEDLCVVTDATVDLEYKMTNKKPKVYAVDSTVTVNGYHCKIVRVQWKTGTYDYYYDASVLKVKPELFEKHILDGQAEYLKIAGSLPIRIVQSCMGLGYTTFTLVDRKAETINSKIFNIPKLELDESINVLKSLNIEMMKVVK
jgi:hypothetical protein